MKTDLFQFVLPPELIAQTPAPDRCASRLLIFDRKTGETSHRFFRDIVELIPPGDLLVLNASKVVPARLFTQSVNGSKPAEILFLRKSAQGGFEAMVRPGRRFKPGAHHQLKNGTEVVVEEILSDGARRFSAKGVDDCLDLFRQLGEMPLPPYITSRESSPDRYQTVFAREDGSVAAPTAGLHFDLALLEKLRKKGVFIEELLLHVGPATFKPIETETIEEHQMHSEPFFISVGLAEAFSKVKAGGGKVWAVGTTSIRSLEAACQMDGTLRSGWQETSLFIKPGYSFSAVDRFITNFHLPRSTLLVLVSAFCSLEKTLSLYSEAVARKYRFFSFGDAMAIV